MFTDLKCSKVLEVFIKGDFQGGFEGRFKAFSPPLPLREGFWILSEETFPH